jgi:hypothetical protein
MPYTIGGGNDVETHPPVIQDCRTGDAVMPGEHGGDDDVSNNPGPELAVEMRLRRRAAYRVPVGGAMVPGRLPTARALETGRKVGERGSSAPSPSVRAYPDEIGTARLGRTAA